MSIYPSKAYEQSIEDVIRGCHVSDEIDAIDAKTVKDMAIEIMEKKFKRTFRRSELKVKQCRNIVFQAVMLDGYQL